MQTLPRVFTRCAAACGIFLLSLLLLSSADAQQLATASIDGVVTDAAGKSIGNILLTPTNTKQGTVRTYTTQVDGVFAFSTLEASDYNLAATGGSGFAAWREALHLEVGQERNIPIRLVIAGNHTTVEVSGNARQSVDTADSVVGGVIDARQIETLPLNGRNYLDLAYLVPGNAPAPNFDPTKQNTVVISSAGQLGRGGNVTVDGADNNDDVVGGSLVNIPEDAVQEFQIATNRFSSSFGRPVSTAGGVFGSGGPRAFQLAARLSF